MTGAAERIGHALPHDYSYMLSKSALDSPAIAGQMFAMDGGQHTAWKTIDVAEIAE